MTTAVKSKPTPAASSAPAPQPSKVAKVLFQGNIAIGAIEVKEQVRKKFDENAHKELTESVRTKGLINSLTLRPGSKSGKYELVAGERRYRAAKAAGLTDVPVRVLDLDAQAAALYQVEENIHRKDLTAIEEARGFKLLLEARKYNVEQLAQLVDKSKVYVYRLVSLLDLPKEVLEAIEIGKITPAHGNHLVRVPKEHREKVWKEYRERHRDGGTASDMAHVIYYSVSKKLDNAIFPKDVAYAGAVACSTCPFNSANQEMLFQGDVESGQCTNAGCFNTKTKQGTTDAIAAFKKEFPDAKFIGEDSGVYALQNKAKLDRSTEVSQDDLKKKAIRAALLEKKDAVYFGVVGDQWNPPRIVVITKDSNLANRALGRKSSSSRSDYANTAPVQSPHDKFIEKAITEHLEAVAVKAKADPSEKNMLAAINLNFKGRYQSPAMKKLLPVTANNVIKAMFLDVDDGGFVRDEDMMKALGVDVAKEKATAKKTAEAQWLKDHPKYKAKKA